jgi:prevent-host-death family protein
VAIVNVHQAKTHLSQLLQEVERGQEVVIARAGVPIARLVAWQAPSQPVAAPGAMRGQITLSDDFDAPWMGCSSFSSDRLAIHGCRSAADCGQPAAQQKRPLAKQGV